MTSFKATKSDIVASGLGQALGLALSHTWAQLVAKIKEVVNRGTLNWSGSNTTYSVPAGYYSGGTLDSRPSYNAGVTAAKNSFTTADQTGYLLDPNTFKNQQNGSVTFTAPTAGTYIAFAYLYVMSNNGYATVTWSSNGKILEQFAPSSSTSYYYLTHAVAKLNAGQTLTLQWTRTVGIGTIVARYVRKIR